MDLLTHICSGIAAASVVVPFTEKAKAPIFKILAAGSLGGALPDIDAISMWSHFDSTIGSLFGLTHSGRTIYGAKFWYSHHAFFHSIVAALTIILLANITGYIIHKVKYKKKGYLFLKYLNLKYPLIIAFFMGYMFHLLGDMPTPASVWGGIDLFWPSHTYIGGSGKIWWWNNYDIFLLLILCIIINCIILFFFRKRIRRVCVSLTTFFIFILILVQINTRQYDYSYKGNTTRYSEMEQHSKEEQKRILGKHLYSYMDWLDKHIPIHF